MLSKRVLLCALYSRMSMAGETHGISVLGGVLLKHPNVGNNNLQIFDMYAYDEKDRERELINLVRDFSPHVLGISCPYGGYEFIKELYPQLAPFLSESELVLFGGALPSFVPEKIISEIEPNAICILGEGEEALEMLIDSLVRHSDYSQIPNLCYYDKQKREIIYTPRKQVDLSKVPLPYREHIPSLVKRNAQIFAEYSRGCSWGACSFCSRHMYKDSQQPTCFRVFPIDRLKKDLTTLSSYGVTSLTFADEDFCGRGLSQLASVTEMFEELCLPLQFDVTMNVRSVYSEKWTEDEKKLSKELFYRLKKQGLNKVFLGVETGSPTQIKRFRKAQTVDESIKAINLLRSENIEVDMGFVMFDPLCTIDEIQESINFILDNDLIGCVSTLGSQLELWIHKDSFYKKMLDRYYAETGVKLYSSDYRDEDLVHESTYADERVKSLSLFVKRANSSIRIIFSTIKLLMRNGKKDSLGPYVKYVKKSITEIKTIYLDYLQKCVLSDFEEDTLNFYLDAFRNSTNEYFVGHKNAFKMIAKETNNAQLDMALHAYFGDLY